MFTKMRKQGNQLSITRKKEFISGNELNSSIINQTLAFAYDMSFGRSGAHRDHRTGGHHMRKPGEIFADTFQGKLSEFAIYKYLSGDFRISQPDLDAYELGEWDDYDFKINDSKVSIKSTKSFGNLMLLEQRDWNQNAEYIPNLNKGTSEYDIFILVRVKPFCTDILKSEGLLYSHNADRDLLYNKLINEDWYYDIPGFITLEDFKYIINNDFTIKQNDLLNGRISMDADNYYIQAGDMRDINTLNKFIK